MQRYNVEYFRGLDQNITENRLEPGWTADAMNMDTEDGDLAVGMGYVKHTPDPIPGSGKIRAMYYWHTLSRDCFVVVAGNEIYSWGGSAWTKIYTYSSTITSDKWDFTEARIGNDDVLLIASGNSRIVKWTGTGNASAFGTETYMYEGNGLASKTYNATKASAATYAESGTTGTFTLTISGWTHTVGKKFAWTVPTNPGNITVCKCVIGSNTYTLDFVPAMASGDTIVAKVLSAGKASCGDEFEMYRYGVEKIVLNTALSDAAAERAKVVGIRVGRYTYPLIDEALGTPVASDKKTLTLAEVDTSGHLAAATTTTPEVKVRGGQSNKTVSYTEIYASRLFAAGDPANPSRLYWSQPPGDTRGIEDWTSDDASDATGGGFVDVGDTNSDPIVGLCALSSQLIIFKQSSVYRMLGDRPANFRIVQVNRDIEETVNTAIIANGDVPYWLTKAGVYYHDGQVAHVMPNARQIHKLLEAADISKAKSCENRDRLYWTCNMSGDPSGYDDTMIIYDMRERKYLLRNGFHVVDVCAFDGVLYSINENRYIYRWERSAKTYDGDHIDAYWNTPFTDLGAKTISKAPTDLFLRGEGEKALICVTTGRMKRYYNRYMPRDPGEVVRIPLARDPGEVIGIRIYNEEGSYFKIAGGVELAYETNEDGVS